MAFEREQLDTLRAGASSVYLSLCCLMDESDLFLDIFCLCKEADIYKKQYPIYSVSRDFILRLYPKVRHEFCLLLIQTLFDQ